MVISLTVGVWLVGFGYTNQSPQGIDDANIFKVYARNLAEGRGFVYQEGGQKVEGFTSLLYTLVLSGVYSLTGELDWSVVGLSLVTLMGVVGMSVWLATWLVQDGGLRTLLDKDRPIPRLLAMTLMLIWLLLSPYFVLWIGISQMDVGLWTVLILGSVTWSAWVLAKQSINSHSWWQVIIGVGLITLLSLCRPEGMVLAGLLVGVYLLKVIIDWSGGNQTGFMRMLGKWKMLQFAQKAKYLKLVQSYTHTLCNNLRSSKSDIESKESVEMLKQVQHDGMCFTSIQGDLFNFSILLASWLLAIIGLTAFRLSYFGYPLPNTYYAKVSPDIWYRLGQGLIYGWEWVSHNWLAGLELLILMIVVAWSLRLVWQRRTLSLPESTLMIASWWSLVMLGLSIVSGGDHFVGWRFMQPIWPLLGLVWLGFLSVTRFEWWQKICQNWSPVTVLAVLTVIMLGTQLLVITDERYGFGHFQYETFIPQNGRLTGELLNQWFDVDSEQDEGMGRLPVVGVITAGGFAWEYQGEVFDLLGLNEVSIAHDGGQRKGLKNHASLNTELTLAKSPDLLMPTALSFGQMQTAGAINELLLHNTIFAKELFRNEQLRGQYRLVWMGEKKSVDSNKTQPFTSSLGLIVFVRKEYLETIQDQFMIVEIEDYYSQLQNVTSID